VICALDTNVLVYAEAAGASSKSVWSRQLIAVIPSTSLVVAVQALGELFRVLTHKAGSTRAEAQAAVAKWSAWARTADTSAAVMATAAELATVHRLSIWDAVQLAAAAGFGCDLFLTEDLQDGFRWRGVEVVNPFLPRRRTWLEARLRAEA
jgi:predicted nucleic acid-binding protein